MSDIFKTGAVVSGPHGHKSPIANRQPTAPERERGGSPTSHSGPWVKMPALVTTPARKGAWKWALKHRPGMNLVEFIEAGGDELLRQIAAEQAERGRKVPQWIAEFLTTNGHQ